MARKKPRFGPIVDVYPTEGPTLEQQLGKVIRLIVESPTVQELAEREVAAKASEQPELPKAA